MDADLVYKSTATQKTDFREHPENCVLKKWAYDEHIKLGNLKMFCFWDSMIVKVHDSDPAYPFIPEFGSLKILCLRGLKKKFDFCSTISSDLLRNDISGFPISFKITNDQNRIDV